MNKEDFAETLNNIQNLTLGQILTLIKKLKYKTIIMIVLFVISLLTGAFTAGRYSHSQQTAVMLQKPFSMRIELDGQNYDFETLTMVKDPTAPKLDGNKVILSLREIKSPFDIVPVGRVVATMEQDKLTGIWRVIISRSVYLVNEAYAQGFNWNGHENDYDFKERFVSKNTIHRYYSDGCVLAYMVDIKQRSIPSSFRWVKVTH